MERQYSAGSVSSGSEMGSRYIVEPGFYMTSFTATIFTTGLVATGVLLITLLISLAVMLQSCQSEHAGVIEVQGRNDYYSYCKVCALHAELNNLQGYDLPNVCRDPAIQYVKGGQYATDLDSTMSLIEDHFGRVNQSEDGFDVVLIEINDLFPSNWFHRFNNYYRESESECMKEARNSKLKHVLRLYMNLKSAGWPIILLSREAGRQRDVTTHRLVSAGFSGWAYLMMRDEDSIRGNGYILREGNVIEGKGYRIKSIISSHMDAVTVQDSGMTNFKLPDPLCHNIPAAPAPY